jgi:hypothetical protein
MPSHKTLAGFIQAEDRDKQEMDRIDRMTGVTRMDCGSTLHFSLQPLSFSKNAPKAFVAHRLHFTTFKCERAYLSLTD